MVEFLLALVIPNYFGCMLTNSQMDGQEIYRAKLAIFQSFFSFFLKPLMTGDISFLTTEEEAFSYKYQPGTVDDLPKLLQTPSCK
jgi:hypothetical protein